MINLFRSNVFQQLSLLAITVTIPVLLFSGAFAAVDEEAETLSASAEGADPYNYDAHVFFVGLRYVFDSCGQAGPRMGATSIPY